MSSYYNSRSFILRNRDYLEADRLVTVFTEEYGKVGAIAKGVKKAKSSLRACTQPFCYTELFLRRGKSLDVISQGNVLDFFGNSRENMAAVMFFLYMAEILDKILPERQPYPELFSKTIEIADLIERKGPQLLWLRYFEAQVIEKMGLSPVLDQCVSCGEKKETGKYFSVAEGGLLCEACYRRHTEQILFLSPAALAVLRLLLRADVPLVEKLQVSPETLHQVEQFWEKYLEYHLERRFHMKHALTALKRLLVP